MPSLIPDVVRIERLGATIYFPEMAVLDYPLPGTKPCGRYWCVPLRRLFDSLRQAREPRPRRRRCLAWNVPAIEPPYVESVVDIVRRLEDVEVVVGIPTKLWRLGLVDVFVQGLLAKVYAEARDEPIVVLTHRPEYYAERDLLDFGECSGEIVFVTPREVFERWREILEKFFPPYLVFVDHGVSNTFVYAMENLYDWLGAKIVVRIEPVPMTTVAPRVMKLSTIERLDPALARWLKERLKRVGAGALLEEHNVVANGKVGKRKTGFGYGEGSG